MNIQSIDLTLLYYDNPEILKHWFHRLSFYSDFIDYLNRINVIIADSGSPLDRVGESLEIVNQQPERIKSRITYARAETEEIRKNVPEGVDARPACHAYNMAQLDISKADLIIMSVIGHIFTPKYFTGHIAEHIKNSNACVLPKRFDLDCNDYHTNYWFKSFEEVIKFPLIPSGGWPDMSVRRRYLQEIGGWDENYTFISPQDMDIGSRLTGKVDNGQSSEILFTFKEKFNNLGLEFIQPFRENFFSLTCNTYGNHRPKNDPKRLKGHEIGTKYYLENWGKIIRNENRKPIDYKILDFRKKMDYVRI